MHDDISACIWNNRCKKWASVAVQVTSWVRDHQKKKTQYTPANFLFPTFLILEAIQLFLNLKSWHAFDSIINIALSMSKLCLIYCLNSFQYLADQIGWSCQIKRQHRFNTQTQSTSIFIILHVEFKGPKSKILIRGILTTIWMLI